MRTTIDFYDFRNAFERMDRGNRFPERLSDLFEFLEDMERETGEEWELDVIALCCDFTEYSNLKEFQAAYSEEYTDFDSINDRTLVIGWVDENSAFIVQNF